MIKWCWLIGHYPTGPIWEHVTKRGMIYIYKCKRCNKLIVFDNEKGWLLWSRLGEK